MRGFTALLTLALVGSALSTGRPAHHKVSSKHFEVVYGWSGVDYVFADESRRAAAIQDKSYIPGHSVPLGFDIDPESGRIFVALPQLKHGNPATLATVSATKGSHGEYLLEPYPDWSYHTRGKCEGFTSVYGTYIDDCGRLWVLDSGTYPSEGRNGFFGDLERVCPAKIYVFDLKTDKLVKTYVLPEEMVKNGSIYSTIVVDVISKENTCQHTYAYVADTGAYGLIVYDYAHDDAWRVTANEMYPYPSQGHFDIKGVKFDFMYGILGLALTPKQGHGYRYLFFNSLSSNRESYVNTSYLMDKNNFNEEHCYGYLNNYREFQTFHHHRPGGQSGAEVFDDNGVLYFASLHNASIYCWYYNTEFGQENFFQVDRDYENFPMISEFRYVKNKEGVPELYILSSGYHKYLYGTPDLKEINFRILKAPISKLVAGTPCVGGEGGKFYGGEGHRGGVGGL